MWCRGIARYGAWFAMLLFPCFPRFLFAQCFSESANLRSHSDSNIQETALAHVLSFGAERFAHEDGSSRVSVCVSEVKGNYLAGSLQEACHSSIFTLISIRERSPERRRQRGGAMACWCDRECKNGTAWYSGEGVKNFIGLKHGPNESLDVQHVHEYEESARKDNLVRKEPTTC